MSKKPRRPARFVIGGMAERKPRGRGMGRSYDGIKSKKIIPDPIKIWTLGRKKKKKGEE